MADKNLGETQQQKSTVEPNQHITVSKILQELDALFLILKKKSLITGFNPYQVPKHFYKSTTINPDLYLFILVI